MTVTLWLTFLSAILVRTAIGAPAARGLVGMAPLALVQEDRLVF
jgi:hypothetical protein